MIASVKIIFLLFALATQVFGGNILFLNLVASPSHHIFNRALVVGLAKNHNVTFVSADVSEKAHPNIHYIHLEKVYDAIYNSEEPFDVMAAGTDTSSINFISELYNFMVMNCDGALASDGLERILNYPDNFKFDVVIHDFTCGPCLLPLVHKFNYPPLIAITAFAIPPYTLLTIGGHKYPAYIPHYNLNYNTEMTFSQRFFNTFIHALDVMSFNYIYYPKIEKAMRKRYNFKNLPSIKEIDQKTVLLFVNTDNAIDYPEPLQPNMIQVGGMQIGETKPLPEAMDKFVRSAKKGTILMSLGTNVKSNMLGEKILTIIIETFAALPQYNFLWKFESEEKDLPVKLPKNVMIGKFLPQSDILAHPKTVGFISHAGQLSTHEALYHGVPVVGIPFLADQKRSISKSVILGTAVYQDFHQLSVENFKSSILKAVADPKIAKRSKEVSKLFQDKPKKPLDLAIWWTEYVMRNPQLDNLRSPTLKLGFFASQSYDVLLTVIGIFHVIIYLIVKLFKFTQKPKKEKRKTQ